MPNRIIKESICTSETVDSLSWFEEVFFYRLIVNCDDFGRFDARPKILKARLFPLKPEIREDVMVTSLVRLHLAGIIIVYMYDERPYLQLVTWGKHQQIRNKKSKYPELSDSEMVDFNGWDKEKTTVQDFENICNHLISSEIKCPRNPIQSESNLNPNCMSGAEIVSEPKATSPPVISLPLNDKTEHDILQCSIDEWSSLYPAVDVLQELRKMKGWLNSNPSKRKTKKGINRFITNWLGREQDKGGNKPNVNRTVTSSATNRFNNFPQRTYSADDYAEIERKMINKRL